jgi:hypothetical protein
MAQKLMLKMAAVAALSVIVLTAAPAGVGEVVATTDLQPFTNIAYIPVDADLSSLRFESVREVKVATTRSSTADKRYCEEGYQEPGGSMYCPHTLDGSWMPAYRVTYSFRASAMASDEYGGTYFTFSVNMRPEDLTPATREAISARKISRKTASEYFELSTSRGLVQGIMVDEASSIRCDGKHIDGNWTQSNPNCEDRVVYKKVTVPSDHITVKVDRVSSLLRPVVASEL